MEDILVLIRETGIIASYRVVRDCVQLIEGYGEQYQ